MYQLPSLISLFLGISPETSLHRSSNFHPVQRL
jgi:hypothetical protein